MTDCSNLTPEYPAEGTLMDTADHIQKLAGRYDLTQDEIIGFMNDAQKWLDRHTQRRQQKGSLVVDVPAGTSGVVFTFLCRAVWRAYLHWDSNSRMLKHISWNQYKGHILKRPVESQDQALFYTEATLRRVPGTIRVEEMTTVIGMMDTMTSGAAKCNGICIHPPMNVDSQVEVIGNFYDEVLSEGWPWSWWLINHPDLLKKATLRELEVYMRNSQGVADYESAMALDLVAVTQDLVEENTVHIDKMEG